MSQAKVWKKDILISAVLFALSLLVYVKTLCPTVSTGDSGELIAASHCLGIAHPPGYPLYVIAGKLFTFLPFGDIGFRLNLMSAFFSSLTVALLYFVILKVTDSLRPAAVSASLLFAFSKVFWAESVVSEVFSLNAFFLVLLVAIVLDIKKRGYPYLFSFIYGLSLCNHQSILLALPAFLYFISREVKAVPFSRKLPLMAFFAFAGFSVYMFMPVRALRQPPLNWGNPSTLPRFIAVLTRAQYGTLKLYSEKGHSNTLVSILSQTGIFFVSLVKQFTIAGFLTGIIPLPAFLRPRTPGKAIFSFLGTIFLFTGIGFLAVSNMPVSPTSVDMMTRFYIMPALIFAVWIGMGIMYGIEYLRKKRIYPPACAFILLPALAFLSHYRDNDRSKNYIAYDFAANTIETVEQGGILFMLGDDFMFPAAYLKIVEKRRPDVTLCDVSGNLFENIYGKNISKMSDAEKAEVRRELIYSTERPVYFMKDIDASGCVLKPQGILYRVEKGEPFGDGEAGWKNYEMRGVYDDKVRKDFRSRIVALRYPYFRAQYYLAKDDAKNAMEEFKKTCEIGYDVEGVHLDLGNLYLEEGMLDEALKVYRESVKINPYYAQGYNGIGLVYNARGEYDAAVEAYLKAVALKPSFSEGFNNLGVVYFRKGLFEKSLEMFRKATELNPGYGDARANYEKVQSFLNESRR